MRNDSPDFSIILDKRLSRRSFLKGMLGTALLSTVSGVSLAKTPVQDAPSLSFKEISKNTSKTHTLAEGYALDVLLRWGDPLFPESLPFDFLRQTPAAQEKQFGASCDFIAHLPLKTKNHALLFVNHEYADAVRMFPGLTKAKEKTADHVRIEMAALGASICEIECGDGVWKPVVTGAYNRRITANTPIGISGPAAGHTRMKTGYDKTGARVLGMVSNCAGGVTPWGTVLTCEENFNDYFSVAVKSDHAESANHARYGIGGERYNNRWQLADDRFDTTREPNEPNRFGWVVEINPYDPHSLPVKRTALGRFKHETATVTFASPSDKRIVVYSGDDEEFEYIYRFVSAKPYDEKNPKANRDLLDDGVLSVARFDEFGQCLWLPLVFGKEPLNEKNGFHSQADVLIETRRAADLLGATPMDRPEGVAVDKRGNVYIALTKNPDRKKQDINLANPRAKNKHGHIIKLSAADASANMAREQCLWDIFLLAGDPGDPKDRARYKSKPGKEGWLSCPDNLTVDHSFPGHLWIATDGQPASIGKNDGLYACALEGKEAGVPKLFFTAPMGAEVTGPCITKDESTLFLSVQHPAEGENSTASTPDTRWPDFDEKLPPRSSVVAIRRRDGKKISL